MFFITKNGNIGIEPKDSAKGDSVAILYSDHTLFILQEINRKSRKWQLIGDYYIYVIIVGEVLDMKRRKDY